MILIVVGKRGRISEFAFFTFHSGFLRNSNSCKYCNSKYIKEIFDCDDQADDMRNYLRKNRIKAGYMKVTKHMKLIFARDDNTLLSIDPGTKEISQLPDDIEYIMWW